MLTACFKLRSANFLENVWNKNWSYTINPVLYYYSFKKYVKYYFSLAGLSIVSHNILRLRFTSLTKYDVMLWSWHLAGYQKITGQSTSKGICMTHQILRCPVLTLCTDLTLDWVDRSLPCKLCFRWKLFETTDKKNLIQLTQTWHYEDNHF